jgi:D-alanyl-D-alanine carboxypeptidase/D-alanyl-D-alanine-endopeptidase (penicillin-binding protein 4)
LGIHVRRVLALAFALLACWSPAASGATLQDRLNAIMDAAAPRSGAYVMDATSGSELFAFQGDATRSPASVEKVYTTTSALRRYGANGTLDTAALSTASVGPDGTLAGDLVLKGGGDPTFGSRRFARQAYGGDASVETLADRLHAAGLKRVQGAVVGDESGWDTNRGVPDEGLGRIDPYVGPLSALSFDRDLTPGGRSYVLRPAAYAAGKLRDALRAQGVAVSGGARAGTAGGGAKELARVSSPSMADIVRLTNRPSDNYLAESLVKGLGARFGGSGSTASGASVVEQTVARDGAHPHVVDGSGLARSDQTSPHDLVRVLDGIRDDPLGSTFRASLPVAARSGTLHDRMRGTAAAGRCQAKTGTLSDVSALAGYCRAASGHDIVFAVMMNRAGVTAARNEQDRFAATLVSLG